MVSRRLSAQPCSQRARRKAARRDGFAAAARATVRRAGAQEGCGHHAVARRRRAPSCIHAAAQSVLRHEHLDIWGTGARYATSFRPTLLRLTRGTNPYRLDAAARNSLRRANKKALMTIQQLEKQRRHQVTGFVPAAVARLLEAPQYWRWRAGAGGRGQRPGCRQAEAEQSITARGGECNKEKVVVR